MKKQSSNHTNKPVGVVGVGTFGLTIAKLLAKNTDVLLYSQHTEIVETINQTHQHRQISLEQNIKATSSLQMVAEHCTLIFPIIPSDRFRALMRAFSPFLKPYHLLIHGTKGLDSEYLKDRLGLSGRRNIHTMSEVIRQETSVVRIGCLSGPNLYSEILAGQPTATVVSSRFTEVFKSGKMVLRNPRFQVFSNKDLLGAELAGALKNTIAIAAGMLGGLGMGYNVWALLISKGLSEMIHIGKALGADLAPFLGISGIGDLVATASSTKSRNYTVGFRIAKGETLAAIKTDMKELAEGVHTVKIVRKVAEYYGISTPISEMIYRILYEAFDLKRAILYLMNYPYSVDVDYL